MPALFDSANTIIAYFDERSYYTLHTLAPRPRDPSLYLERHRGNPVSRPRDSPVHMERHRRRMQELRQARTLEDNLLRENLWSSGEQFDRR